MPEFVSDTGAIVYEVIDAQEAPAGPPPTLTLLHNFMSTGRAAWGALLPELSRRHRIILPDLPGHGRSVGHPWTFDHRVMAAQLAELLRREGADDGHLAGCSSGGMIAQLMVHGRLIRPRTVTLVSTTHSVSPATTGDTTGLSPEDFQAARTWMEATARLHDPYRYTGYYEMELLPGFRRLTPEQAIDLPLSALRSFTMPLCIIHGEQDEFFPSFIAQRMAAAAPDAELHLIPRQTHSLLFRQPWQVSKVMVEFLARN